MTYYETLGLKNQFNSKNGKDRINFRNGTNERDDVVSIEITKNVASGWHPCPVTFFAADPEDNMDMALSLLGVGRVTKDAERQAQQLAARIVSNDGVCVDGVLKRAIVSLRALLIAKQSLSEDAWSLRKLTFPNSSVTKEEFMGSAQLRKSWEAKVKNLRSDV